MNAAWSVRVRTCAHSRAYVTACELRAVCVCARARAYVNACVHTDTDTQIQKHRDTDTHNGAQRHSRTKHGGEPTGLHKVWCLGFRVWVWGLGFRFCVYFRV
jgi:hypothetical protein